MAAENKSPKKSPGLSPFILGSLIVGWLVSGLGASGSMFQIAVAVLALAWLHLQVCAVKEMSDVLQIPIFTLDDPKKCEAQKEKIEDLEERVNRGL